MEQIDKLLAQTCPDLLVGASFIEKWQHERDILNALLICK